MVYIDQLFKRKIQINIYMGCIFFRIFNRVANQSNALDPQTQQQIRYLNNNSYTQSNILNSSSKKDKYSGLKKSITSFKQKQTHPFQDLSQKTQERFQEDSLIHFMNQKQQLEYSKIQRKKRNQSLKTQSHQNILFSYFFQYISDEPQTLTMTSSPKQLVKLIYSLPIYVWIDENSALDSQVVIKLQHHLMSMVLCFQNIQIASQILQKQNYQNIQIICPLGLALSIQQAFGEWKAVKSISCYSQIVKWQDYKYQKILGEKFKSRCQNLDELVQILIENRPEGYVRNEFLNFIAVSKDIGKSNTLTKTMYAMVNQETNKGQLIDEAIRLAKYMGFQNQLHFKEFTKDLQEIPPSMQKILYWYTKQSFVYILVNTLLRIAIHPSEIYCIQPYFKQLFSTISKIQSEQKMKSFICYRGAFASQSQLQFLMNNVGEIIQNLNFMSTSRIQQVARKFLKNVLFVIEVQQNCQKNFGFAHISPYSDYKDEEEILFNPLNFFRIIDQSKTVIEGRDVIVFSLLFAPSGNDLSSLKKYQQQMILIKSIGDVLVQNKQIMHGSQKYWQKHKQLCVRETDVIRNLQKRGIMYMNKGEYPKALKVFEERQKKKFFNNLEKAKNKQSLARVYYNMGQYQKSLELYNKCQQILKASLGSDNPEYIATLDNIGFVYDNMGQYQKSLEFYKKCQEIKRKILGIYHPHYGATLNNIANSYQHLGQYKKSLQNYKKCLQIYRKSLGIDHPQYATTLNHIGLVYMKMGNYEKSLEYYHQCQEIKKKSLGIEHPNYAITINSIAGVYDKMGLHKKSLSEYLKCEKIFRISLGNQHPFYAATLINIAGAYFSLGEYEKSIQMYKRSEQIKRKYVEKHQQVDKATKKQQQNIVDNKKKKEKLRKNSKNSQKT